MDERRQAGTGRAEPRKPRGTMPNGNPEERPTSEPQKGVKPTEETQTAADTSGTAAETTEDQKLPSTGRSLLLEQKNRDASE